MEFHMNATKHQTLPASSAFVLIARKALPPLEDRIFALQALTKLSKREAAELFGLNEHVARAHDMMSGYMRG
jgi:DNA-directed RNA polymerase specialized sigma24 family protein